MNRVGEILNALALAAIRFYQAALRPMNPWGCKYYPSCSNYTLEAIELHGVARGAWLGARRLLRCRPLVFGGFDPVPDPAPQRRAE
jgi:hypothetical protein